MKTIYPLTSDYRIHQMTANEHAALSNAESLVLELVKQYPEGTVLMSPNTGEVIMVDELKRVAGILSFLTENRVVEVNP